MVAAEAGGCLFRENVAEDGLLHLARMVCRGLEARQAAAHGEADELEGHAVEQEMQHRLDATPQQARHVGLSFDCRLQISD